ncbi:MAG: SIS domain-containing protein [Nitrososphaerota archaeon]
MSQTVSSLGYINRIFQNIELVDAAQQENFYYSLVKSGVIIPSAEGRSKGALSIVCSEMAKMTKGKIIVDRSDLGFPGRSISEAAPILKHRYGYVSLLINSGSGKSLMPLIDAQSMALYIEKTGDVKNFSIDVMTSDANSPIGKLGEKYGNILIIKGREENKRAEGETREFQTYGILEDVFILSSMVVLYAMAEAMNDDKPAEKIQDYIRPLSVEIGSMVDDIIKSKFFEFLLDNLEERKACFFAGLGSGQEVARMTAVRVGHVKRAIGDHVYVAGESSTPAPRAGDILVVISQSGETEIVLSWCKNFKRLGGKLAAIVGTPGSTLQSIADESYVIKSERVPGKPSDFYVKAAFALSPLPIYLVSRIEGRGLRLPEYILRWYHSVM